MAIIIECLLFLALIGGVVLYSSAYRNRNRATSRYEASVSADTFTAMVLETSNDVPVLVDFYAGQCPPCQDLGPLLTELVRQYQGRFLLANLDADAYPALGEAYAVTALPTVILFRGGRAAARFVGALPAPAIRQFLAQHGVMAPDRPRRLQHD